jgi:hypothetical protein
MLRGKNPFRADKSHLHHLLVRKGLSPAITVLVLWAFCALAGFAAFVMREQRSLPFLLAVFYGSLVLSLSAMALAWRERKGPSKTAARVMPWSVSFQMEQKTRGGLAGKAYRNSKQ